MNLPHRRAGEVHSFRSHAESIGEICSGFALAALARAVGTSEALNNAGRSSCSPT
jgi:hypothetical protein